MRFLINYIRQVFCKHEFEKSESEYELENPFLQRKGTKVFMICKKCGYYKSFWKF